MRSVTVPRCGYFISKEYSIINLPAALNCKTARFAKTTVSRGVNAPNKATDCGFLLEINNMC